MVLKPLWSWNVRINNNNNGNISTIRNATQNPVTQRYVYSYSYSTNFNSYSPTIVYDVQSPANFDRDRFETTWTVPKGENGFYRIRSWAEETVDHWIYINGREFLHNSQGQRYQADLYVYLNDRDVVRVIQNNNNDFQAYRLTFYRATKVHTYQWGSHKDDNSSQYHWDATIDSPYVTGSITLS